MSPPDARLTLESLGAARLVVANAAGSTSVAFDSGKPLALIAYLAASAQSSASREHCLDLLWADLEPDAAKHALRQTLWYIKRKVSEGIITASGDALMLAAPIESDRAALITAAERGEHERVVDLYKGDFLPGFAAPGGAEFEQWADVERRRLRILFYRSAEAETRRLLSAGRARDAIVLARRARDLDPLHQPSWRLLLEALVASRDQLGAQLEADALESFCTREDVEPEPATRAIIRVARQTPNEPAGADREPNLVAELVGREREFAAILAAWDDARAGRGRHIHIRAAAGLGKTRLLNDVHARLRASRARVRVVRFRMGTRDLPYVAAADVAATLADLPGAKALSSDGASALLALNPSLSSIYQGTKRDDAHLSEALRRRAVALRELLACVTEETPVALLIDDLHWSDEPSRALLKHLVADVDQRHLLLITTGRPARGLLDTAQPLTLDLAPLDEQQTHALVSSIAALPELPWARPFAAELLRASLGSPLHALETLQLLMDRGLLGRHANEWLTQSPEELVTALRAGNALRRRVEQLGRTDRWILLLLSVAGVPLSARDIADVASTPNADPAQQLTTLESAGFLLRHGDELTTAHDEISEIAIELASDEARHAAHAALGRQLWQRLPSDLAQMRRATAHLAQAGDRPLLAATYVRFVRQSRQLGDMRSYMALADDLLGGLTNAQRVRELVRSLPIHMRLGLTSGRRVAAAVALATLTPLTIAIAAATVARDAPAPDAELVLYRVRAEGPYEAREAPLSLSTWPLGEPIQLRRASDVKLPSMKSAWIPIEVPGKRGHWIYSAPVTDSGVIDVFTDREPGRRRLTHSPGDDMILAFSPDGRFALVSTARWNSLSRYNLAIIDLATGAVRQLTTGDNSDGHAQWSSDGTQIAFVRRSFAKLPLSLCRIHFDGSGLECPETFPEVHSVAGWIDDASVLAVIQRPEGGQLGRVDLDSRAVLPFRSDLSVRYATLAPNASFVACLCAATGTSDWRWRVIPLGRESDARDIDYGAHSDSLSAGWRAPREPGGLRRLTIINPASILAVGVPHHFHVTGISNRGPTGRVRTVRWSSSDPAIVAIDSVIGAAIASKPGLVTITADAGGWVRTSVAMNAEHRTAVQVLGEKWSGPLDRDWVAFGSPAPFVNGNPPRNEFRPNGDGRYESGVVSRRSVDGGDGVAADAELSVAVTLPQWQSVQLSMQKLDLNTWPQAERERGRLGLTTSPCGISYPAGENRALVDSIAVSTASESARLAAPIGSRAGGWMRIRVQILPDGRCAIALNGKPMFISESRADFGRNTRVVLYGNSYQTSARIGPVILWRGVPNDIDWAGFERTRDGSLRVQRTPH